jgi:tRNA G18 (ribose-2'-O)-methylase SpoU
VIRRIDRLDDPRVAGYAHLLDPSWFQTRGLFVAEGRLVVERLVQDQRVQLDSILVTPAAALAMGDLLERAAGACPVYLCAQDQVDALAGFHFHRGCLAIAHRPDPFPLASFADQRLLVALEGIGNHDNVGGIFRNALAFGAGGVILDVRSADPLYRKAIRTSMGAVLRVPFTAVDAFPSALAPLRDAGFRFVALTPAADAVDISAFAASAPASRLVLLLGSEGGGLSEATLAAADVRVRIPMDPRGDSLNVAVAAGIALHRLATSA